MPATSAPACWSTAMWAGASATGRSWQRSATTRAGGPGAGGRSRAVRRPDLRAGRAGLPDQLQRLRRMHRPAYRAGCAVPRHPAVRRSVCVHGRVPALPAARARLPRRHGPHGGAQHGAAVGRGGDLRVAGRAVGAPPRVGRVRQPARGHAPCVFICRADCLPERRVCRERTLRRARRVCGRPHLCNASRPAAVTAAGINVLPAAELDAFIAAFSDHFAVHGTPRHSQEDSR